MSKPNILPIRIYYEDTDAGGIVFYANYLKFMERGRTEFLRDRGLENSKLFIDHKLLFVVRKVEADYLKPLKLDDMIALHTSVTSMGRSRIDMLQEIYKGEERVFSGNVVMVCVDASGKPAALPDHLKNLLSTDAQESI